LVVREEHKKNPKKKKENKKKKKPNRKNPRKRNLNKHPGGGRKRGSARSDEQKKKVFPKKCPQGLEGPGELGRRKKGQHGEEKCRLGTFGVLGSRGEAE